MILCINYIVSHIVSFVKNCDNMQLKINTFYSFSFVRTLLIRYLLQETVSMNGKFTETVGAAYYAARMRSEKTYSFIIL